VWSKLLYWATKAQPLVPGSAGQERRKRQSEGESGCCGQPGHALTMAEWEQHQYASTVIDGEPAAVLRAPRVWRSSTPSGSRLDSCSKRHSMEEKDCKSTE